MRTSAKFTAGLILISATCFPLHALGQSDTKEEFLSKGAEQIEKRRKEAVDIRGTKLYAETIYDDAINDIRYMIDNYIEKYVSPQKIDTSSVQEDLAQLIHFHKGDLSPPYVFVLDIGNQRSLVISYVLYTGDAMGTAVTLHAYKLIDGHFETTDVTGSDLDDCLPFVEQLPSPSANTKWLLVWGRITGSNGIGSYRARIYAYDGNKFTAIWQPDIMGGVEIKITHNGFIVTHADDKRSAGLAPGWKYIQDVYVVSSKGPHLIASRAVPDESSPSMK